MKKDLSIYQLIVITVFIGLLLSFAIVYLTNTFLGDEPLSTCYDGSTFEAIDPVSTFHRAVYQNEDTLTLVHEYQYRLFGIVNSHLVIAGQNDFLFEIEDARTGYQYLEDYTGNSAFTEAESAAILEGLQRRKDTYAQRGAEYLLVILPNAQTVYSEYMPTYCGPISENTRLALLGDYLAERGFYDFLDLTEDLKAVKGEEPLYNNTENTLNALGLYYVYRTVYAHFSATVAENTTPLAREELEFYQHLTTGKTTARKAGLAQVVQNRTVSLSNATPLNYRFVYNEWDASTSILLPFYIPSEVSGSPELLLQFSGTWERLQIEPFFSNTFSQVTYQTNLQDDPLIFEASKAKVVIQFVYESELSLLKDALQ